MRPVHTCFRTALNRAFRPSPQIASGAWAVPDFLAPAVVKPLHASRRSIAHSSRQQSQSDTSSPDAPKPRKRYRPYDDLRIPPKERTEFKIPLPEDGMRKDMESWLSALDPFLPAHLRRVSSENGTKKPLAPVVDYARLLIEAQFSSQDILSYLGITEGRWNVVMWLIKHLVEEGSVMKKAPGLSSTSERTAWADFSVSLKQLTEFPIHAKRIRAPQRLNRGLKELTSAPETIQYELDIITGALGQVWRSLGFMILVASEEQISSTSTVMSHVLETIAYLHHVEMIPQAIYKYTPIHSHYTLQQPPTLHLLSSRILTSLSDATWRAHEASVQEGKDRLNSRYFLGHEIPGSRYKITVPEVGPEVWLELVLWSCLHGGWILDGVAILEKLLSYGTDRRWSVICWRDNVASSQYAGSLHDPKNFEKLAVAFEYPNRSYTSDRGDRHLVQRTISSEVVAAFVDGLTNTMRVGVGARGTSPELIVAHIKNLKQILDQDNLSLGTSSWDAVILRLLESHGIIPEKKPYIVLDILALSQGFGKELASANVTLESLQHQPSPNYVFEPSAAPIGLLHRTLRAFVDFGNTPGALKTLQTLQEYTDNNKMVSMTAFFETLKYRTPTPEHLFSSNFAPIDFPGFFPQIPVYLLAAMLDLLATSRNRVCNWLLFSRDLDGPLIPRRMYRDKRIAPSVIRYGTVSKNKDLLLNVVEAVAVPAVGEQSGIHRLPAEVMSAFLNSQIEARQWSSVKSISEYAMRNPGYIPRAETLAVFASAMLRDSEAAADTIKTVTTTTTKFSQLLIRWQKKIQEHLRAELNTILGILSTVHPSYIDFSKDFWTASGRQHNAIETTEFNKVLEGVATAYGAIEGKRIMDLWCNVPPGPDYWSYRSPGGVPTMAKYRPSKGAAYDNRPLDIEVKQFSDAFSDSSILFRGRVTPNIHTYRVLLRAAKEEYHNLVATEIWADKRIKFKEMLTSVAYGLRSMGLDLEDVSNEFGELVGEADLPAANFALPVFSGWDEEEYLDDI